MLHKFGMKYYIQNMISICHENVLIEIIQLTLKTFTVSKRLKRNILISHTGLFKFIFLYKKTAILKCLIRPTLLVNFWFFSLTESSKTNRTIPYNIIDTTIVFQKSFLYKKTHSLQSLFCQFNLSILEVVHKFFDYQFDCHI